MVADVSPPRLKSSVRIPLPVKLKARSLYLIHGLPYREIAAQTGLTPQSVRSIACREGWTQSKAATKAALIARADTHARETIDEVSAAIAADCDEIALSATGKAKTTLAREDEDAARDFQSITGGLRNVVQVARMCRGLDAKDGERGGTTNIFAVGSINFAVRADSIRAKDEPVNVTPATTPSVTPAAPALPTVTPAV